MPQAEPLPHGLAVYPKGRQKKTRLLPPEGQAKKTSPRRTRARVFCQLCVSYIFIAKLTAQGQPVWDAAKWPQSRNEANLLIWTPCPKIAEELYARTSCGVCLEQKGQCRSTGSLGRQPR